MKKIFVFTTALLWLCTGCVGGIGEESMINRSNSMEWTTIEIEECQYIIGSYVVGEAGYGYMAHKGNCYNCAK